MSQRRTGRPSIPGDFCLGRGDHPFVPSETQEWVAHPLRGSWATWMRMATNGCRPGSRWSSGELHGRATWRRQPYQCAPDGEVDHGVRLFPLIGVPSMNVILESEPGAELICVTEFLPRPRGRHESWETMRTFRVGDRVRYVGYYRTRNLKDNQSAGWSSSTRRTVCGIRRPSRTF